VSDGTAAGTHMAFNLDYQETSAGPRNFKIFNDKLFFSFSIYDGEYVNNVYVTDGTESGTIKLNAESFFQHSAVLDDYLYFISDTGKHLVRTDGTIEGTSIVKEITDGSFYDSYLFSDDHKLYFDYFSYDTGQEQYVSDGTALGTNLLVDLIPGVESSYAWHHVVYKDKVYFVSTDEAGVPSIYRTDGTEAGTDLFAAAPSAEYTISALFVYEDMLYLTVIAPEGAQIVRTNGELEYFEVVEDFLNNETSSENSIYYIVAYDSGIYYLRAYNNLELDKYEGVVYFTTGEPTASIELTRNVPWGEGPNLIIYEFTDGIYLFQAEVMDDDFYLEHEYSQINNKIVRYSSAVPDDDPDPGDNDNEEPEANPVINEEDDQLSPDPIVTDDPNPVVKNNNNQKEESDSDEPEIIDEPTINELPNEEPKEITPSHTTSNNLDSEPSNYGLIMVISAGIALLIALILALLYKINKSIKK
ncbi:MAG TPA: hypothetical protein PK737_02885, partial [Bacilli bacterium]|nr:hypothetical protein [Bacilli bacterium]